MIKSFAGALVFLSVCAALLVGTNEPRRVAFGDESIGESKIRVLVLDGGHPYDEPEFAEMLTALGDRFEFERARLPEARARLKPGLENDFDVLLFYDMCQVPSTDEEYADFVRLATSGKIGLFFLHHHFSAHPERADFWKLSGGSYVFEQNRTLDGEERPISSYEHGVEIAVAPIKDAAESPFPLKSFSIVDEIYYHPWVSREADVFLTGTGPGGTVPVAWTWRLNGDFETLTVLLGHDAAAYCNVDFQNLLKNGLVWAASERVAND